MKQKGFSLIECMVYSSLFALLTIMLFGWLITMHNKTMNINNSAVGVDCILDMLVRDVRMAFAQPDSWKKITKYELIWHGPKNDVGWQLQKGELFRIQGIYSPGQNVWIKKTKNLIAKKVENLTFDVPVDELGQVVQVICVYNQRAYPCTLRNRRVL